MGGSPEQLEEIQQAERSFLFTAEEARRRFTGVVDPCSSGDHLYLRLRNAHDLLDGAAAYLDSMSTYINNMFSLIAASEGTNRWVKIDRANKVAQTGSDGVVAFETASRVYGAEWY
jgi:hypothetical protein